MDTPQPSRAAQRKQRLLEMEHEQRLEDIEALKMTEEQRLLLFHSFRSVKFEWSDLDGMRPKTHVLPQRRRVTSLVQSPGQSRGRPASPRTQSPARPPALDVQLPYDAYPGAPHPAKVVVLSPSRLASFGKDETIRGGVPFPQSTVPCASMAQVTRSVESPSPSQHYAPSEPVAKRHPPAYPGVKSAGQKVSVHKPPSGTSKAAKRRSPVKGLFPPHGLASVSKSDAEIAISLHDDELDGDDDAWVDEDEEDEEDGDDDDETFIYPGSDRSVDCEEGDWDEEDGLATPVVAESGWRFPPFLDVPQTPRASQHSTEKQLD